MCGAIQRSRPEDHRDERAGASDHVEVAHQGHAQRGGEADHVHGASVPSARGGVSIRGKRP